jgi:hypothetical protein
MQHFKISCLILFCAFASQAWADTRVFIVANQPDGYGIDRCLASGAQCGAFAARAYCKQREFSDATAFRRIDPAEVTSAIPAAAESVCTGATCAEHVAITCEL